MPKVLTEAQVERYQRDGCLSPVRAMSAERARHYREKFEALEARVAVERRGVCLSGAAERRGPGARPLGEELRRGGPDRLRVERRAAGVEGQKLKQESRHHSTTSR